MNLDQMINATVTAEGGYVNDPHDPGGETNFGITVAVARANGYTGDMRTMPRSVAVTIYRKEYIDKPGFAAIALLSPEVAAELFDSGVNLGVKWPGLWLQAALNAFNQQGKLYPDLTEDGAVGKGTVDALKAYLAKRGKRGVAVMVAALNAQQGARYLSLAKANQKLEDYTYGWFDNRVAQ